MTSSSVTTTSADDPTPITVVAAVFSRRGEGGTDEVLCFRRAPGRAAAGRWEFPGGKVEPHETHAEALARELDEELGCSVVVGDLIDRSVTVVGAVAIDLVVHGVSPLSDWPTTSTDHDELRWVATDQLGTLSWADPDLPAVSILTRP